MPGDNIIMLQTVASGLGDLVDEMVFVGGAVAELYADDPASSDIRPTQDYLQMMDYLRELKVPYHMVQIQTESKLLKI